MSGNKKNIQIHSIKKMDNKYALITGSSHGIGLEIAKKFAEKKINLYLVSRNKLKLKKIAHTLRSKYNIIVFEINMDINNYNSNKFLKGIRKIDILINCAALSNKKSFLKCTKQDFKNVYDTNVKSIFFLSQMLSKIMKKNISKSYIINITSILGIVGNYNRSLYSSSKFALEGLTKNMALDLISSNINVNSIAPTKILTKKNESVKRLNIIRNKIPQKKFPTAREVAECCFFLCSGKVDSITGSTIMIDGGWTIL
jgi:NAD(P)-dependent dehydrogenase (short-subunit alcohol dehydrogenase family)